MIPVHATTKNWLTRQILSSPTSLSLFMTLAKLLGYNNPKQIAGRRAFGMYKDVCAVRADQDVDFWRNACHLPPTFQSWFTITNLHVWLLTVRLRALPPPHGDAYVQALIDHFFMDVEDRVRAVLQPHPTPPPPYTFHSPFYTNPNAPHPPSDPPQHPHPKPTKNRAPDRLVTRQMKIFKEQWAGMGMSFDLGLVRDDMEMAGAVWRNLLGARGARGIAYPSPSPSSSSSFRRSVNLVGGLVDHPATIDKKGLDVEESRDDRSGVHDFPPDEADKYVAYPEVMLDVVKYVRRELIRLDEVSDDQVMGGGGGGNRNEPEDPGSVLGLLKFRNVR